MTEWRRPSSTSASTSACTAREKPQISALSPAPAIRLIARASSSDTRGEAGFDPLDSEPVEQPRDLELLLGVEDDADGLLSVAQRGVVEADRPARLRLERALVEVAEVELVRRNGHTRTMPSGNEQSFSGAPSVISQLSSTRRPPPSSQ